MSLLIFWRPIWGNWMPGEWIMFQIIFIIIYIYIYLYLFIFAVGTQRLSPRPGCKFGLTGHHQRSMDEHVSKNSLGICTSASRGKSLNVCQKLVASAPQKAGGVLFEHHCPKFPITSPPNTHLSRGSSLVILQRQICTPKLGKFKVSTMVGFAEMAPKSPCANFQSLNPFKRCSIFTTTRLKLMSLSVALQGAPSPLSHQHRRELSSSQWQRTWAGSLLELVGSPWERGCQNPMDFLQCGLRGDPSGRHLQGRVHGPGSMSRKVGHPTQR